MGDFIWAGKTSIHPLLPLIFVGGMLEGYRKAIRALGSLLRSTHRIWGRDESTDTQKLISAQGGNQAKRKGRSSRQRDCKVKGLMAGGSGVTIEENREWGNGSCLEMLSSTLPCSLQPLGLPSCQFLCQECPPALRVTGLHNSTRCHQHWVFMFPS